jgi:L-lactate dehydrogenase complex protein LldG
MSEARDDILAGIRRSLGVSAADTARRQIVEARIAAAARGVLPQRGEGDVATRAATFQAQAESVAASVARVATDADIPAEIARFLRENNLPATLRMGEDARLAALPWDATTIGISKGPSNGDDLNAVSHAEAGVAETGTLVLVSGPHNPTTLNFLPDNHIVVLRADAIAANYESVWSELRTRFGKGLMPRTVNLITGPSRSADIEQKMLLGAHGPRRLHIVVVG